MSLTTSPSRWATLRRRYKGSWRQNPWINAVFSASQARGDAIGGSSASVDAESAADREHPVLSRSATSERNDSIQEPQQKAAMRTWENEGGSLGTHQSMRRSDLGSDR